MSADWAGARCILCLKEGKLSEEHVIPSALGGSLTCRFLCPNCNSRLGSHVETSARSDPSIVLAAREVRGDIPGLSKDLMNKHAHVAIGQGPPDLGTRTHATAWTGASNTST